MDEKCITLNNSIIRFLNIVDKFFIMKVWHYVFYIFLLLLSQAACNESGASQSSNQARTNKQSNTKTNTNTNTSTIPKTISNKRSSLISGTAARKLLDDSNTVFIDVRTPEEIAQGAIADALQINYYDKTFKANINKLNKNKQYVVYCRSGGRSAKAVNMMHKMGFSDTKDLDGGYSQWIRSNN